MPVAQWKRRNASSQHVEKSCPVLIDSCLFALFQWQKKIGVGASYPKISACPAVAAYSAEAGCEGLDRAKADVIHTIRGRIFFRKLVSISVHSWLDPAFPRRASGKRERHAKDPRPDRVLESQRFRISSSLGRNKTGL